MMDGEVKVDSKFRGLVTQSSPGVPILVAAESPVVAIRTQAPVDAGVWSLDSPGGTWWTGPKSMGTHP